MGYAVAMEVARRPEGPEVNGDLRKTVSRRSLVGIVSFPVRVWERDYRDISRLATSSTTSLLWQSVQLAGNSREKWGMALQQGDLLTALQKSARSG